MKNQGTILISVICLLVSACGNNNKGELRENSSFEYVKENVRYSTKLHGKRIAIEGYVTFSTADLEKGKATIDLSDKPYNEGDQLVSFEIKEGTGKNCVDFGETSNTQYRGGGTISDVDFDKVRIFDNKGKEYPLTQKIRLSGNLSYIKGMDGNFTSQNAFDKGKTLYNPEFKNVRIDVVP